MGSKESGKGKTIERKLEREERRKKKERGKKGRDKRKERETG